MHKHGKTCIIYCRVSSADQLEGTSLDTQEQLCREYAARSALEVHEVFIERGESAKTANRTELNRAIAFCSRRKKNRVDYFLVYKLDRFARNQEDHVTVRAMLRRSGTELRSVTEPIDDSPIGRAMEGVLSVFAEFDNNVRTERTKAGMLARLRQGFWCWQPPLGYHRPAPGANISPDPHAAPHIRYAFEEFSKGFITYRALAERLATRGLRTGSAKPILYQTVEKIIKNPLYCGIMEVWGEKHRGSFVPIVSEELWLRCQDRFSKPSPHSAPRAANNPLFPLRRLVRCRRCFEPLTGSCPKNKQGRSYAYYHHWRPGCPAARAIPKHRLEQSFIDMLRNHTPAPETLSTWRLVVLDTLKQRLVANRAQYAPLDRALDALKLQRHKVFELHRTGFYSDDDFREQLRLLDDQIQQNRLRRSEEVTGEDNLPALLERAIDDMRNPAGKWVELEADYEGRLRFQERMFEEKVLWDGQSFETSWNTTFRLVYRINWESHGDMSRLVALVRDNWSDMVSELQRWYGDPA
jgi:DNA invertase Pin-like site-specific DNA recombinase